LVLGFYGKGRQYIALELVITFDCNRAEGDAAHDSSIDFGGEKELL